jgi:hypothetical protein
MRRPAGVTETAAALQMDNQTFARVGDGMYYENRRRRGQKSTIITLVWLNRSKDLAPKRQCS